MEMLLPVCNHSNEAINRSTAASVTLDGSKTCYIQDAPSMRSCKKNLVCPITFEGSSGFYGRYSQAGCGEFDLSWDIIEEQ